MRIHHQARTDTGRRSNNEDALLLAPELGLFAVADGMGGYEGGELASQLALGSLRGYFDLLGPHADFGLEADVQLAVSRMDLGIRIADREIRRAAVGPLEKMGTTLVSLVVQGRRALVAHVGDSRVYLAREGRLAPLTRDHSLYAEMEAAGLPGLPPRKLCSFTHVITRALGQGPDSRADIRVVDVEPGDRFILCSDGLTDVLGDDEIEALACEPEGTATALVNAAYTRGSADNITVVVVDVAG